MGGPVQSAVRTWLGIVVAPIAWLGDGLPLMTLQQAFNAAEAGETVHVLEGQFTLLTAAAAAGRSRSSATSTRWTLEKPPR